VKSVANPDFSAVALNEAMAEAGVSGSELARRVGCGASTISQWRNGITTPTDEMLERLTDALGVPKTDLLTEDAEFQSGWKGLGYRPYKGKPTQARTYDPAKDTCRCGHPRSQHRERIPTSCESNQEIRKHLDCPCRSFTSRQVLNRGRREEAFWESVGQE